MTETRLSVKVSEICVAGAGTVLYAIGLGSCVAVVLYDPVVRVGGLAHVMLPSPISSRRPAPPGRFATTAIEPMIAQMQEQGAARDHMYARLIGGAAMFESVLAEDGVPLGTRNADAARAALAFSGIPLRAEEVGGNFGRTVHFHVTDGRVLITSVRRPEVVL